MTMKDTLDFINRRKFDLALLLILIAGVTTYLVRNFVLHTELPACKESDVYITTDWSECTISGVKTRTVTHRPDDQIQCAKPENVPEPKDVASCDYVPVCTPQNFDIGEWGACINGTKKRSVKNLIPCVISDVDKQNGTFDTERECTESTANVLLLKDYVTQVAPDTANPYLPNYRNLTILPKGKFKSVKLIVAASTTVRDGRLYAVPDESYYFMFGLNDSYVRALGTSRIADSRLDVSDAGIIQGTDMPKTLTFDLSKAKLAKGSGEGIGNIPKDFLKDVFNVMSNKQISMTLFLADGRSMTTADVDKRVFGRINTAYLEYECDDGSKCEIERVPSLNAVDSGALGTNAIGSHNIGQ